MERWEIIRRKAREGTEVEPSGDEKDFGVQQKDCNFRICETLGAKDASKGRMLAALSWNMFLC